MTSDVRVVKVGGSLFDYAELPVALHNWLTRHSESLHVLVAGGGDLAETIRTVCVRFGLDPTAAHWICIDLLTASARMLAALLPAAQFVSTYAGLQLALQRREPAVLVFAVADFLHGVEPQLSGPLLPHAWSVTSDSIAARLASALTARVGADEVPRCEGWTDRSRGRAGGTGRWVFSHRCRQPTRHPLGQSAVRRRKRADARSGHVSFRVPRFGMGRDYHAVAITAVPSRAELPASVTLPRDAGRKSHCLPSWSIERHGRPLRRPAVPHRQ